MTTEERAFLQGLRQREVQAMGAAISLRSWHGMETAYNALRDKIDRHETDAIVAERTTGGEGLREADRRRAVNTVLAKLLTPLTRDLSEAIEMGNDACTEILAALSPPPIASQGGEADDGGVEALGEALARLSGHLIPLITAHSDAHVAYERVVAAFGSLRTQGQDANVETALKVLRDWHLSTIQQEDDPTLGYPLLDAVSTPGGDVSSGESELGEIAYAIIAALKGGDK